MGRGTSAFDRLSKREKMMVGGLLGVLVIGGVALAWILTSKSIADLETKIEEDRTKLQQIYALSSKYQEQTKEQKQLKAIARKNRDASKRMKTLLSNLAGRIKFDAISRQGIVEGTKRLSDVIEFKGVQEKWLSKPKKRPKKGSKDTEGIGFYRREQEIRIQRPVPFDALYDFLERIENGKDNDLFFVTELKMKRRFDDGDIANNPTELTVATYYYKSKPGEADE